jgi:hypothetical protein
LTGLIKVFDYENAREGSIKEGRFEPGKGFVPFALILN